MATNKRLIKSNDEGGALGLSFNTVTYTGNSSTQSITGVGFQPDLVWIKRRNTTEDHAFFDSVRGALKMISSNLTAAEYTTYAPYEAVSSFDSDGFTTGDNGATNRSPNTYVAWCWKAGGAAVTNTDGTITSQVSANTEAGFSIVSYTASGGGNYSVGHGLGKTPDFVIVKPRNENVGWTIWSSTFPNLTNSYINFSTMAVNTAGTVWGNGMTSTVIGQTSGATSNPNQPLIAYCFAEVEGFSSFGSYVGNGTTSNNIVTGFEPAFLMTKRTDVAGYNWYLWDNKRNPENPRTLTLQPDNSGGDYNYSAYPHSFLENGFSVNTDNGAFNASGGTYIYMAFANQF